MRCSRKTFRDVSFQSGQTIFVAAGKYTKESLAGALKDSGRALKLKPNSPRRLLNLLKRKFLAGSDGEAVDALDLLVLVRNKLAPLNTGHHLPF